ncbi:MAG: hypothetical protein ACLFU4_06335 [Opitutales bacterium]
MSKVKEITALLTLWYKPGRTLQGLIHSGRGGPVAWGIAVLFGLLQSFAIYRAAPGAGAGVLLLGPVCGLGLLFLFAWLMRNFGRWFGAAARLPQLRLAIGWGLLPWLLAFGLLAVMSGRTEDPEVLAGLFRYFFIPFAYGYVILLLCLQVALQISFLKTFLCFLVTCLVTFFPVTLLAQLLLGPPAGP